MLLLPCSGVNAAAVCFLLKLGTGRRRTFSEPVRAGKLRLIAAAPVSTGRSVRPQRPLSVCLCPRVALAALASEAKPADRTAMTDSPKSGAREVASQPAKQEFRELLLA